MLTNEVIEMGLCEQDAVILKPNQTYVFRVISGCKACEAIAKAGGRRDQDS